MDKYFLWPNSSILRALTFAGRLTEISKIEDTLKGFFPEGYPVLCSSGRAALVLALLELGATRATEVGVFPFASHCVLDAISRVATPVTNKYTKSTDVRLIYHQWGYIQETNLSLNTIEDCVDTLCVKGAKLFPGGGQFEIWSLPKILGVTSGGVLWCRDEKTAQKIRLLRGGRGGGELQWLLRLLSKRYSRLYSYWQGAEGNLGNLSRLQTGEILKGLNQWEEIVSDRLKKLHIVWPYAVKWLKCSIDRLPTVVPIECNLSENDVISLGITSGYRMMQYIDENKQLLLYKILPVPIHQDVSQKWLEKTLEKIG